MSKNPSSGITAWESVGHLLEEAAARQPDNVLFIYGSERATFSDVNRRVNRLANALLALGIAKGERIAVMLPNRVDFPIC